MSTTLNALETLRQFALSVRQVLVSDGEDWTTAGPALEAANDVRQVNIGRDTPQLYSKERESASVQLIRTHVAI